MKASDDKFQELEVKMREYEELLLTTDKVSSNDHSEADKLSTIAESASLEGQVSPHHRSSHSLVISHAARDD